MARLSTCCVVDQAIRNAELVIEAVPEELEAKQQVFTAFAPAASACTSSILAPKCA